LRLVVIACVLVAAAPVRADTVAMLPLDGEKRLEIYGQPIAAEIGRALKDHGIDVVVVGAKMAVPDNAQVIVDGTIKAGKSGRRETVTLALRIRDPRDGTVLELLAPVTSSLDDLDKAAAALAAKIVPSVRTQLAKVATKPTTSLPTIDNPPSRPLPSPGSGLPSVVVAISAAGTSVELQLLRSGIVAELEGWTRVHGREARTVEPTQLERNHEAPKTVAGASTDVGIALHVLGFAITPGKIPMAKARVRVRIVDREKVRFDRVVITDTIVGDRTITPAAFAARAAREVLAIVQPNLRRTVTAWK
jgi:hypothetical protein